MRGVAYSNNKLKNSFALKYIQSGIFWDASPTLQFNQLFIVHCSLFTETMPLYEYRCNPCGEFEAWRSMSEYNAPIDCPQCNRTATKVFSAPNINLNSGSLSAIARSRSSEPRLVKQEAREPAKPRYQSSTGNRPWMVSHVPVRF